MREFQKGFYIHYKHNPALDDFNYVYEALNIGHHTETNELLVVYRPLYEAYVYKNGKHFDIRPLEMFLEDVEKDGKIICRFSLVKDKEKIALYKSKSEEMYGS